MEELNQYFISRVLGSTMKGGFRPVFGFTGGLRAVGSALSGVPRDGEQLEFSEAAERKVVRAFEDVAGGLSVDRLLAEPTLATRFYQKALDLGVRASKEAVYRRLLVIRKNPRRGIRIPPVRRPTRLKDPHRSLYAAEFALTQLNYRYGASVDDILACPAVGEEFDKLAQQLDARRSIVEHRLAALYIRKRRHFETQEERQRVGAVPLRRIEDQWVDLGTLADPHLDRVGHHEGLLLVSETGSRQRDIYAAEEKDLEVGAMPLVSLGIYETVGDQFWRPRPDHIQLKAVRLDKKHFGYARKEWLLKLIQTREPIFNWRVRDAA